jgi:hypothetical protein
MQKAAAVEAAHCQTWATVVAVAEARLMLLEV